MCKLLRLVIKRPQKKRGGFGSSYLWYERLAPLKAAVLGIAENCRYGAVCVRYDR